MNNNAAEFFDLMVPGDSFAPRVKSGEQLTMCRGLTAEDGDIVAVGLMVLIVRNWPSIRMVLFITPPPLQLGQKRRDQQKIRKGGAMSVKPEELSKLEKLVAEKMKKDAEAVKSKEAAKHLKLVSKANKIAGAYQSKPSGYLLHAVANAAPTPMDAKTAAIVALLANIKKVDLVKVCESLGWIGSDDDYPKQKHIKVAVIHTLIETARTHNWHIIHDAGFFYIFNGAYWVTLLDSEVKQLLKDAAIEMSYTEIECRDSAFVDKLFQQSVQDGFFVERNLTRQSIINLKNGSLVLNEGGVTLKPFDYRDFLTHQLDFKHNPEAINNTFLTYLQQVLPDGDTRRTLQQVAGYLFVKGLKMEKIFFLFGTGANGKSVFFEVLRNVHEIT